MSEESRLGREQIETAYALKQIMDAGVRVFFYLEDRERTLDSALDKMMLSLTGFASEMERERAKQRTYDAMLRKAKAGHVTGGKVYGYDNQEVLSAEGHRLHVLRVVNQKRLTWSGRSSTCTPADLGLRASPSGSMRKASPRLARVPAVGPRLQCGRFSTDRSTRVRSCGTSTRRSCAEAQRNVDSADEKDWIRLDAPDLRIISPGLWATVQARLSKRKRQTAEPPRDQDSKYLLTGMARCAHCGGPMTIVGQDYHRRKGRFYGCSYYKNSWLFDLQELTAGRARVPGSDRAQVAP